MQNKAIKKCIKSWPLEEVEEVPDVFGECLIEEYQGEDIPEGQFNDRMFESLIGLSSDFKKGVLTIEQAADKAIEIITDPLNYN